MLRNAVERSLHTIDTLESLCQPGLNLGTQHHIDRGCARREGSGRSRKELHGHYEIGMYVLEICVPLFLESIRYRRGLCERSPARALGAVSAVCK